MARIICGISDIPFTCSHIPIVLANREYTHPIFMLPQRKLLGLYSLYVKGNLTDIDAYLLFLALLNSTDAVEWVVPTKVTTSTPSIIASNIGQLVKVIWETNAIVHPSFKQPRFFIRSDTNSLDNIKVWIAAWQDNITLFKSGIDSISEHQKLIQVEKKLAKIIFSPEAGNTKLASAVAEWADKAAAFPSAKREAWKLIIRKCYNLEAMFSTPKEDIVAIKNYCEENLESGSIHFHNLMKTLRTGISNHNDFLGLGSFDSTDKNCGYTLLDTDNSIAESTMLDIIKSAPDKEPTASDYPNKLSLLKARLAYRQAIKSGVLSNDNK